MMHDWPTISYSPSLSKVRRKSHPHSQICLFLSSPLFQIKDLEDDIRTTLAMLRRHVNPLESPIYCLPSDLFPEIVSHLASETDLINATHVSYHLRNSLLSHPILWSHLKFGDEMRARTFFERSGQVPLHVDMGWNANQTVALLTELRRQSKRIVTLKLRHWPIQKVFLSEPMPFLHRLEISSSMYHEVPQWDRDTSWALVWGWTEKATSWFLPSLTSLAIGYPSPIPLYTPNLTCFKFWEPYSEDPIEVDELVRFLNNCPLLEHIDVCYDSTRCFGEGLVMSLPNLRTYTQTTIDDACFPSVLDMFSIPPLCSITLRFRYGGSGFLPKFENPDYMTEIKRMKFTTTRGADGDKVARTLEFVNTKGTRVCFERIILEEEKREVVVDEKYGYWSPVQESEKYTFNTGLLDSLRDLDGGSMEILCIEGYALQDDWGPTMESIREALNFQNVRTLILSSTTAASSIWPFDDLDPSGRSRRPLPQISTLIVHPGPDRGGLDSEVLAPLLSAAKRRKAVGFPFSSVLLFLPWLWDELDELRRYVGKLEVVMDDYLDWDVDKYFLDGLEHLQRDRGVQWDPDDI